MRIITVEEHFISPALVNGPGCQFIENFRKFNPGVVDQLAELGEKRIVEMDEAGIDVQILSLNSPGVEQAETDEAVTVARDSNDFLAMAVRQYPSRFYGLAAIATSAPEKAAAELEARVRNDAFKGAIVNGHTRGRYLDDKFFWPILECAETLSAPIYLHPTLPPKSVIDASYGGLPPHLTTALAGWAWGWHIETAVHLIRMIVGGVFDRFPKLQVVIGHLGEGIPFMMPRLNASLPTATTGLKRPVSDYLRENVHYTFGGFNYAATFQNLLLEVGTERIMFSVDYPYASMKQSKAFLEGLPLAPAERARIAHGNAEQLFRLGR